MGVETGVAMRCRRCYGLNGNDMIQRIGLCLSLLNLVNDLIQLSTVNVVGQHIAPVQFFFGLARGVSYPIHPTKMQIQRICVVTFESLWVRRRYKVSEDDRDEGRTLQEAEAWEHLTWGIRYSWRD